MKIRIDDYCIRCGICIDLYPELYKRNFEEDCIDVLVNQIPPELRERAISSARDCAVSAIKLREWEV
ncbi:MAG: ferredoxin [Clostridiales bacterium]|nr:ferredoxin [Clostridiales bacterium]